LKFLHTCRHLLAENRFMCLWKHMQEQLSDFFLPRFLHIIIKNKWDQSNERKV
jgi:hypothetical protein